MNDTISTLTARRKAIVLASCCLSLLIVSMDATIVNVAIPAIRTDLGATASQLQWVIDVYTLVLAYAGSALPLLLLFSVANRSLGDVLVSESVAIEIARSAVGGIALALSVPLTTAIAAVLSTPTAGATPTDTPRNPT